MTATPNRHFIDKHTSMDDMLAMIVDQNDRMLDLMAEQHEIDYEVFTVVYPHNGTRLIIAAGTTNYDFMNGTVEAPGADIVNMSSNLKIRRKDFMRALTLNADKEIIVQLDNHDKNIVRAGSYPLFPHQQFTKVLITATVRTEIVVYASTSADAIIRMHGEVSPSTHAFTGDVYENEHTMTALDGWDVSSAVYSQNFSVAGESVNPVDVFFKSDGTKMYALTDTDNDVNEYDLSVAWDVSSAVYLQNFSVATQETNPHGIFFKPDGLKMYIIGYYGKDVNEYDLGVAWDVSSAVYSQNFSVATQEFQPVGVFFKPDGLKMYIIGYYGKDVNEYDLGVAWDVSSAVYSQNFSVAGEETSPAGVFFKPDGLKMYIIGYAEDEVNEYDLGVAWDVSSAVYSQNFSVATQETIPRGISFSPNGEKMYIIGTAGDAINEYDLTPYRFETSNLLLRDVLIGISTYDAEIGNSTRQRYPAAADSVVGFTKVNLAELYIRNANPANNTTINILGTRL